jgi:hypothetical protein
MIGFARHEIGFIEMPARHQMDQDLCGGAYRQL